MSFEIPPTMAGHVAGFLKQVSSKLSATGGNEMDKLLEIVALDDDRMAPVARGLAWSCMQQPTHYQYILYVRPRTNRRDALRSVWARWCSISAALASCTCL